MCRSLDTLKEFEEFREKVLPVIHKDMNTMTPEEFTDKYTKLIQARQLTIALTDHSAKNAMSAIRDLRDRMEGKPTEKRKVTVEYEDMPDEQFDAILMSELEELEEMDPGTVRPPGNKSRH